MPKAPSIAMVMAVLMVKKEYFSHQMFGMMNVVAQTVILVLQNGDKRIRIPKSSDTL